MTIFETLQSTGLPCAYSHFRNNAGETPPEPPFLVYIGRGQYTLPADDTFHYTRNLYQVEYYYTQKSSELEAAIEQALLDAGFLYEKSEDSYIEDMDCFVIYYYV